MSRNNKPNAAEKAAAEKAEAEKAEAEKAQANQQSQPQQDNRLTKAVDAMVLNNEMGLLEYEATQIITEMARAIGIPAEVHGNLSPNLQSKFEPREAL